MLEGVDYVWMLVLVVVMGGMWWVAYRMEPHYASKDGHHFLSNAQEMVDGTATSRARETRITVMPDGLLLVAQKRLGRRTTSRYRLVGRSPEPPKKLHVYVAQEVADGSLLPTQLFIRVPQTSRVVPVLDSLLA